MKPFKPRFPMGSFVRMRLSPEAWSADSPPPLGLVTGIVLRPGSQVYCVTWSHLPLEEQTHWEVELVEADEDDLTFPPPIEEREVLD